MLKNQAVAGVDGKSISQLPGVTATAEDAVHLLRRLGLSTLLCHTIGAAPFALAVLVFWSDITNYRPSESACAMDAAVLAVALAWMNSWRAIFAGRIRDGLTGVNGPRPNLWRLIALQAFLGGAKLFALPLAALTVFPLAPVVAFFRYAAALSGRGDLDPIDTIARAAQLARREQRLGWTMLPFVAFLQFVAALNAAALLAALPQLVRILTGYESAFSRNGRAFITEPLFVMAALMVAWMAVDPFVQAVYGVMCFRIESLETGEDIRAALRRLKSASLAAAAVALAFVLPACAAEGISQQQLRESIQRTLQSHQYDWRLPPEAAAPARPSWLLNAVDAILHFLGNVFNAIGRGIESLLRWIFGERAFPMPQEGAPPAAALHWSIYVLSAIVIGLALCLLWRMRRSRREKPKTAPAAAPPRVRLRDEDLTPDRLPEDQWLEMAEACLRDGDFRLALRALYLANLAWLGRREMIAIHPGKTNREYDAELRRRARGFPEARELFAANVRAFERSWYGTHEVAEEDAADFRARNLRIKALLEQPDGAAA